MEYIQRRNNGFETLNQNAIIASIDDDNIPLIIGMKILY